MQRYLRTTLSCFFLLILTNSVAQSIDEKALLKNLKHLSSDEMRGRQTGSEENKTAREFLLDQFKAMELETHYADFQQEFSFESRREGKQIHGVNVEGFIAGKSSRKLIVITAHYDHVGVGKPDAEGDSIYNGADDNASGTAALLELAKYFKKHRPEHSMIFAALDGEEMGLQGAKALVNDFPFPLEQIVLEINMDMISRNDRGELYASGTYYNPSLKPILEQAAVGSPVKLMFGHDEPNTGIDNWTQSSDQGPFFKANVPHIYFGVEDHKDYHKPSDSFENIEQKFYVNAVKLILASVLELDKQLPLD